MDGGGTRGRDSGAEEVLVPSRRFGEVFGGKHLGTEPEHLGAGYHHFQERRVHVVQVGLWALGGNEVWELCVLET